MAKRNLRIVRETPLLGVCEYCNAQFESGLMPVEAAKADIQERFNVHKCEREDVNCFWQVGLAHFGSLIWPTPWDVEGLRG
jgi:hypothetical protein